MGLTAILAATAGLEVKKIGSLELIAWADTESFLKVVRDQKIAVLGIEGFRINGQCAVPDMDAMADFSGLPIDEELVAKTIAEAKRFLFGESRPSMYFDFALDD